MDTVKLSDLATASPATFSALLQNLGINDLTTWRDDFSTSFGLSTGTDVASRLKTMISTAASTFTVGPTMGANYITGDKLTGAYTANGGNGQVYVYSNYPLPTGISMTNTGAYTGTFTAAGKYVFIVNAIDAKREVVSIAETVTVVEGSVLSGSIGNVNNHALMSGSYTATGGVAPYVYSYTGTLPPGLSIASTGVRTGQVTTPGTYPFTVIATDANGHTGSLVENTIVAPISFSVAQPMGNLITGRAITGAYTLTGNGSSPYTFAATGVPPGVTISNIGNRSGTPTTAGSYAVAITVTDANGETTSYTDNVTVGVLGLAAVTPGAGLGQAYAGNVPLTGVYVAPVTASSTNAPSWVTSITVSGTNVVIAGTPLTVGTSASFDITVSDAASQTATQALTVAVAAVTLPVTGAVGQLHVGDAFTGAYTTAKAYGTVTYTTTGTLPPGYTLASNGTRSGTATAAGTYAFTVTATDSLGNTGSLSESIVVLAKPYSVWDPAGIAPGIVLSNGAATNSVANADVGITAENGMVISDTAITGKVYFEAVITIVDATGNGAAFGWVNSRPDFVYSNSRLGDSAMGAAIYVPSGEIVMSWAQATTTLTPVSAGVYRLGIAVDVTAGTWWATNDGTTWFKDLNGVAGNPAGGTNTLPKPTGTPGTAYIAATPFAHGNTVEIVANPALLAWAAPTGFTAGVAAAY